MKRKHILTESKLKRLVEEKVDEAWYNNLDDFYHGVGKCATIGALGTGLALGAMKGCENDEQYKQSVNQQAAKNMYGSDYHYQKWCQEHELDPNNSGSQDYYNDWCEGQLQESRIRYMVKRAIVESMVRKTLKRQLTEMTAKDFDDDFNQELRDTKDDKRVAVRDFNNEFDKSLNNHKYQEYQKQQMKESTLYTDDVDTSDLRVSVEPYNEDGYCEWEATCDNGWYTFRGTYANGDCELDDVISGHSGYGHQHAVDDEMRDWFYNNLYDTVVSEIEAQA